jgi:pimeloyl-ACP methyl ester carboxylesterase
VSFVPETRYARRTEGDIAYQVIGSGPIDVILFAGAEFPIDLIWEAPECARFLERLSSFSRLILFDPAGFGGSDPADLRSGIVERFAHDALVVLNDLGSQRAAVVGACEIASAGVVLAATHPDRISALVVINGQARYLRADDYDIGVPEAVEKRVRQRIAEQWGTGTLTEVLAPSAAVDPAFVRMRARWERLGAGGPQQELAMWDVFVRHDIREVLPAVRVPTLVLHRRDNPHFRIDHGRYLASHIKGAHFVELPGRDHVFFVGDTSMMLDEIETFLTGVRGGLRADRVLATVLFTDIVGSTEQAARLGDRAWRSLLDSHDHTAAQVIGRYRGRLVKTTGDGVLATFDGPARAIQCACSLRDEAQTLGLDVRAGLHTGEVAPSVTRPANSTSMRRPYGVIPRRFTAVNSASKA